MLCRLNNLDFSQILRFFKIICVPLSSWGIETIPPDLLKKKCWFRKQLRDEMHFLRFVQSLNSNVESWNPDQ